MALVGSIALGLVLGVAWFDGEDGEDDDFEGMIRHDPALIEAAQVIGQ